MVKRLSPEKLRRTFDIKPLGLENTKDLEPVAGIIGQERAVKALQFGLEIAHNGYNIYVSGPSGIGKMTAVESFLEARAGKKETPPDWCYVNNFTDAYQPRALELPAGRACMLQRDMNVLIDHIRHEMPRAFESEDYQRKREEMAAGMSERHDQAMKELSKEAQAQGFSIQPSQMGILIIPMDGDQPLSEKDFQAMPEFRQEEIRTKQKALQEKLKGFLKEARKMERSSQETIKEVDQQVGQFVVGGLLDDLMEDYEDLPDVVHYLQQVKQNILENLDSFKGAPAAGEEFMPPGEAARQTELLFRKYQVNLLVDNCDRQGAPVVLELNPGYHNLIGRIEKESQFGTLTTDFTMIKPGSLHRANGGYLVIPVDDLLRNGLSWEGLKRALRNNVIEIEEIGDRLGFMSTKSLRPQAIPLDVKVILVGRQQFYYLLHAHDEEFPELFKVKADFSTDMDLDEDNIRKFIGFVGDFCERESLKHLDAAAVERLMEYSSRIASDQEKLSTKFGLIADVIREANFWARRQKTGLITARHIRKALDEKILRSNLIEEKSREYIEQGTILIDCSGEKVGQVNGLSVLSLGEYAFGKPGRITVSVGPGRGGILDIEREVKLGGPLHTKGVLILSGYLADTFGKERPITMSARIVFEQSYGGIDGDSASSTELYAILSALSGVPIRQNIAVTGSVNQRGEVQAIGGVNEKIEGYYDVCFAKGLTGDQGVLIPDSNVRNLMLREDIVKAVKKGKFHIYAVKTINEGIEVLTGVEAGELNDSGYPAGSINALVAQRLEELAESLDGKKEDEKNDDPA